MSKESNGHDREEQERLDLTEFSTQDPLPTVDPRIDSFQEVENLEHSRDQRRRVYRTQPKIEFHHNRIGSIKL